MTAPLDRFTAALRAHGCRGSGRSWTCPAHEDQNPSLSVREGQDGRVLVHCFAGCETAEVLEALGMRMGDLFHEPPGVGTWRKLRGRSIRRHSSPRPESRPSPVCRIGLPTDDDAFWALPDWFIHAHFELLMEGRPGPSDAQIRAFLARREREGAGRE